MPCAMLPIILASDQWAAAMNNAFDEVIDVTKRLAEALPDFLSDWTHARLYLVSGHEPSWAGLSGFRAAQTRGGLSAGTLRRIRAYIESELSNAITLRDLASMAGLSDCHFARAFKQSVGVPPHRYLMNRRVERASALIRNTNRPLAQIALDVGFCDQSHFSRSIARATGQTPRALRRKYIEPTDRQALVGIVSRIQQG